MNGRADSGAKAPAAHLSPELFYDFARALEARSHLQEAGKPAVEMAQAAGPAAPLPAAGREVCRRIPSPAGLAGDAFSLEFPITLSDLELDVYALKVEALGEFGHHALAQSVEFVVR